MRRAPVTIAFVSLWLAACGIGGQWVKSGVGEAQLAADRLECSQRAGLGQPSGGPIRPRSATPVAPGVGLREAPPLMGQPDRERQFNLCMEAKGYRWQTPSE